jgi:tetratricopeptide (TPR) repeat protein
MKGSFGSTDRIVVATSFPPQLVRTNAGHRMEDYDRLCVQSWVACGFKIIALNAPDEIPALASRYPEVAFIPTERNANTLFGRRTPFIADILAALARESAAVLGIINSDVLFEPTPAWQGMDQLVAQKSVVTGQRCDTKWLAGGVLHRYLPGFDYFFFEKAAAEELASDTNPFSMGLPWWDYWFPVTLALRGYDIRCVARPNILHLAHESGTEARSATWRRLAVEYSRSVLSEWESSKAPLTQCDELLALCRGLANASGTTRDTGGLDERIIHLSELSVPVIARNIMELGDGTISESVPPGAGSIRTFFEDIPNRLTAGDALHKALWHEDRQELRQAHHFYGIALEKAPRDGGVLYSCGNYCYRRGDLERAAVLFRRSVELLPDSGILLNSLGSVLGELGRRDEAIVCFEKAMNVDPRYVPTYYNLAIGLYPHDRHREIIGHLEGLMGDGNFPDGQEWLDRIREALLHLQSPPTPGTGFPAPR